MYRQDTALLRQRQRHTVTNGPVPISRIVMALVLDVADREALCRVLERDENEQAQSLLARLTFSGRAA